MSSDRVVNLPTSLTLALTPEFSFHSLPKASPADETNSA